MRRLSIALLSGLTLLCMLIAGLCLAIPAAALAQHTKLRRASAERNATAAAAEANW